MHLCFSPAIPATLHGPIDWVTSCHGKATRLSMQEFHGAYFKELGLLGRSLSKAGSVEHGPCTFGRLPASAC